MGIRAQVWGPDPCQGLSPRPPTQTAAPPEPGKLLAQRAKKCGTAAAGRGVRAWQRRNSDLLVTGMAGIPQTTSCSPPALPVASKLVGSRLRPGSHAQDSWLGRMDRAPLCATRDCRSSLTSSRRSPPGKPQATLRPSRLAVCLLHVVEEVTEELIPEEHEASGQGSLQQAGGQALEEAPCPFLPQHLLGTIYEALVASNLGRRRLPWLKREVMTTWMLGLFFCLHQGCPHCGP